MLTNPERSIEEKATTYPHVRSPAASPVAASVGPAHVYALPKNNLALTGIRGLAALWVYWFHMLPVLGLLGFHEGKWLGSFLGDGYRGVDMFFVLSGFILMYVHSGDFSVLRLPGIARFYALRFFRVWPTHLVALLIIVSIVTLLPDFKMAVRQYFPLAFMPGGLAPTALLVQNWFGVNVRIWNGPAWTLSAEVLGYVAFPMLAYLVGTTRSRGMLLSLALLSLSGLCAILLVTGRAYANPFGWLGLLRMAAQFFAGICLSQYFRLGPQQDSRMAGLALLAAFGVLIAAFLVPLLGALDPIFFGCLILGLAYQRGFVYRICSSAPAAFMGEISYSFYLIHWVLIQLVLWAFRSKLLAANFAIPVVAFGWLICVALAWVLYRLVELPSRRMGRWFVGQHFAPR